MKKVLLISAFVLGMVCLSGAASQYSRQTQICNDDVGATSIESVNYMNIEMPVAIRAEGVLTPLPVETQVYALPVTEKTCKGYAKNKIYLLNCSIRQC